MPEHGHCHRINTISKAGKKSLMGDADGLLIYFIELNYHINVITIESVEANQPLQPSYR
jgi:hypothetical protein